MQLCRRLHLNTEHSVLKTDLVKFQGEKIKTQLVCCLLETFILNADIWVESKWVEKDKIRQKIIIRKLH